MAKGIQVLMLGGIVFACVEAKAYSGSQRQWTGGGDGTTLNADANWNNGAPGTTDVAQFALSGTLNLQASADFGAACAGFEPKDGPLTVNMDLGGYTWTGGDSTQAWGCRFVVGGTETYPVVFNFTGGTVTGMSDLNVGVIRSGYSGGKYNTTLNITGAGTRYTSSRDQFTVGNGGTNNVLNVSDGAFVSSGREFRVGVGESASSNRVCITGAGTIVEHSPTGGNYTRIGDGGSWNELVVADGAEFSQVANGIIAVGDGATARRNRLAVSSGATVSAQRVCVGYGSAAENTLSVSDNGLLQCLGSSGYLDVGFGSYGNEVVVSDSRLAVDTILRIGYGAGSCNNRVTITGASSAELVCGIAIGINDGSNSNLLFVADGAVVTNATHPSWALTAAIGDHANAVGNRMVVSGATFYSGKKEFSVNGKGRGNSLEVLDGGQVVVGQSLRVGNSDDSCYGLVRVAGEGSVLSNTLYHLYVDGHHNGISVENGAKMEICPTAGYLRIGNSGAHSNNYLRIANGEFKCASSASLTFNNKAKFVWEGARSKATVTTLTMSGDSEIAFVADGDGIATFGPKYETYLLNDDWTPSIKKITVDARAFFNENERGTFTVLKSENDRTCRTTGTKANLADQSAETIAAVNRAFAELVEFVPAGWGQVESVDMEKSTIVVSVKKRNGFSILFR